MRGSGRSRIEQDIAKYGWHSLHVFPENETQNRFTYTIGFSETYNGPEVAIFGLDRERAHELIGICASLLAKGENLEVELPDDRLLKGGYKVMFREVVKEAFPEYFGTATRYFGNSDFRAVVMFFPDAQGRFPWEAGYSYIPVEEALKIVKPLTLETGLN
jgi:hypothetical protein